MKTRTITVHIKAGPEIYVTLMRALNNGTDYEGSHVMQYSEYRNKEGQLVGEFTVYAVERSADHE